MPSAWFVFLIYTSQPLTYSSKKRQRREKILNIHAKRVEAKEHHGLVKEACAYYVKPFFYKCQKVAKNLTSSQSIDRDSEYIIPLAISLSVITSKAAAIIIRT